MASTEDRPARDYGTLMKQALIELDALQRQLDELRRARTEPIAVVGMACRFPGSAYDLDSFWALLREGVDTVAEVPRGRWDLETYYDPDPDVPGKVYCRRAALLDQSVVEQFDPAFFGIAPREAERMDPQQRILLEVCWEALENAGVPADAVSGSRTGLFVGSCTDDYLQLFNNVADPERIDGYSSLGTARCITVGRVAYLLGVAGPVVQLDTACSSSLVAVHQACQSLRSGDSDMILAGGVNLQLSPAWSIGLCKLKALSPDGCCRAFDAGANGFVRGEGCGMIVLKRLSDAMEQGDRVLAVIRGTAVNHDGRSSGLTVPNPAAQEQLLRRALDAAGLQPEDVDYVEAHGTGTALGDPIEMAALGAVFGGRDRPLWVGSLKTNIGHLEGAAGIAGLIKTVLALQHRELPPHLHFHQPNPHIPWHAIPVRIPVERTAWPRGAGAGTAGVSSFGFSGTNAHVIVQEAPRGQERTALEPCWHLLAISARSPEALRDLAGRHRTALETANHPRIGDLCFTAAVGRAHFPYRVAVTGDAIPLLRQRLDAFLRGQPCDGVWSGVAGSLDLPAHGPRESSDRQAMTAHLAAKYAAGGAVDWGVLFAGLDVRRVALPTYPFQRQRYWLDHPAGSAPVRRGDEFTVHPLLGRRGYSAGASDLIQFEAELDTRHPPYLADHRVGDVVVLPATAQIEMALTAGSVATDSGRLAITNMTFHQGLPLREGAARVVQTILTPHATCHRFELFSRPASPPAPPDQAPTWTRHTSGEIAAVAGQTTQPTVCLADLSSTCTQPVPVNAVYERIARQGLRYGPSFQLLQRAWRGSGQALGEAILPAHMADTRHATMWHPALIDACLHTVAGVFEAGSAATVVPVRLDRLELFARPGTHLWSHVRLRESDAAPQRTAFSVDVDLFDPEGAVVARFEGLHWQHVEPAALAAGDADAAAGWAYDIAWRELPIGKQAGTGECGTWLLLGDRGGVADLVARRMVEQGQQCVIACPGATFRMGGGAGEGGRRIDVRPDVEEDFARLVEEAIPRRAGDGRDPAAALRGVVHFWSLEVDCDDTGAFAASHQLGCGSALRLVQALIRREVRTNLFFVTRGARVMAGDRVGLACLAQSPLAGLARVAAMEHREVPCVQVDLDPASSLPSQADCVLDELAAPAVSGEHVAYRHGVRHVARLARHASGGGARGSLMEQRAPARGASGALDRLRADGSYLITGGLGELGLHLASWLAEHGARHIVLSDRSGPDTPARREPIERLRRDGVDVRVLTGDIGNPHDVRRIVETIRATLPPLRGVLHAAGVLDDAALLGLTWSQFERVMHPKVAGAWNLHRQTDNLDFFVMFSSAAGLLGSLGQANYAAANACLDTLAEYRRAMGQPAVSIAWGPWAVGMSARLDDQTRGRIAQTGLQLIGVKEGLEMLRRLDSEALGCAVAVKVDWRQLAAAMGVAPLWSDLVGAVTRHAEPHKTWASRLQSVAPGNRLRTMTELIRSEVAQVLGWDAPNRVGTRVKLFDLGLDSITSVELQRCLERNLGFPLPLTLAFDYPSVEALAQYAMTELERDATLAPPSPDHVAGATADVDRLAAMSDQEVQSLLADKFKDLM